MGSFYTNIHVRTHDRELIERDWHSYWEERGESSWAWVSPVYGGWISLFDYRGDVGDADALTELAAHLSRSADSVTLAFQVQDSDLAEYWLFHHGKELDHYKSNSDYFAAYAPPDDAEEEGIFEGFGPDSKPGYAFNEDLSDGGNIRLLHSLTGDVASEIELEAILRTPATVADDILTALASAIGINDTWAAVGYHYLVTEGDTIPGIAAFHHLPVNTPPNAQRFTEHD